MLATPTLPLPTLAAPRLRSAGDLCKAMLAASGIPVPVDASGLDRTLRHDTDRGLLEVQAGVTWASLEPRIGTDFLPGTVGESFAENCAGPDGRPVVAHLHALTMATADGELHRASRERAADLFRLAVGSFGAFGQFYSLTLDLPSLARSAAQAVAPAQLELAGTESGGQPFTLDLLVPPSRSDEFVGQVRAALGERRCSLSQLEARRVVADEVTLLRWARCEYVAIRIAYRTRATLGACASGAQLRAQLLDLAISAGGSFMPRMLPVATRAQALAGYPMLAEWFAEKRRLDPAERMQSLWYRGVRRAWRAEPCATRWAKG